MQKDNLENKQISKVSGNKGDEPDIHAIEIALFLEQPAKDVVLAISSINDKSELQSLLDAENAHENPRKTVLKAIKKALSVDSDGDKDERRTANDRGLTEADADAMDHSAAIVMKFKRGGYFITKFGTKIEGRKGEICALHPNDVEKAIKADMMEKAKE